MSLFGSIGKALRSVAAPVLTAVGGAIGGPVGAGVGAVVGGALGGGGSKAVALPTTTGISALPGAGFVQASALPRAITLASEGAGLVSSLSDWLPDVGVPGPGVFSQTTPPKGYHLSKRPPYHFVKNRRMNPLNPRAFRRAARRIKGAQKFAKEVDKLFPIRPRARRAPRRYGRAGGPSIINVE